MSLERNQSRIRGRSPAQIALFSSVLFVLLNDLPEQEGHSPQIVKTSIGATILINQGVLVTERNNAGNRIATFRQEMNRQPIAQAIHQIAKPGGRLRGQLVAASRDQ